MTKIIKMSLVAAVAVAGMSTVSSANTLKEAFAASTVKGEIKSQYFQKQTNKDVKSSIFTNGGNVSIKTGSFNGLTAGVTFQTGHVASDSTVSAYQADMDASGSVMSESYLAYTINNTTAKIGRQYITTPLVAGSGSRMFKQSFEAAVLVNTDVADTTLVAAYVTKYQNRTANDGTGNVATFDSYEDGAYTVYAKNTSIDNLTIQAQYAAVNKKTNDDQSIIYLDADYKLSPVTISGQTIQSDDGSATGDTDGSLYGIKVAGKVAMISLVAAYTTTDTAADVISGIGSGADKAYTAGPISGGAGVSTLSDTDSYKIGVGTTVMGLGLNASYNNWDQASVDKTETNVTASYAFNKELSTKVMYSKFGGNSTQDYRSRVYLSYKF